MPSVTTRPLAPTAASTRTVADRLIDAEEAKARWSSYFEYDYEVRTEVVDDRTFRYLEKAQRAIEVARRATPDGAGNQKAEVERSDGLSYARLRGTRSAGYRGIRGHAEAAHRFGGANCGEFASMTYAALVAQGVNGVPVLRGHMRDADHAFTVLGDSRQPGPVIAVDAWPVVARALIGADSRFYEGGKVPFVVTQQWNDSRPNPNWDFSHLEAEALSMSQARERLDLPEDTSILEHLRALNAQKKFLWDECSADREYAIVAYRTAGG